MSADLKFFETARYDGNERQWGMTSGISFLTDITTVKSGFEKRFKVWNTPRGYWQIGNRGVSQEEYKQLYDFFYNVAGQYSGFRLRDWSDYTDEGAGTFLKIEDTDIKYQMYKKREIKLANIYTLQKVYKPIGPSFASFPDLGNTIKFFWNDNEIIQSNDPSSFLTITLDDTTGIFTFNPANLTANVSSSDNVFNTTTDHHLLVNDGVRFTLSGNLIEAKVTQVIDSKRFLTDYTQSFDATSLNVKPFPTNDSNFYWTGMFDKAVRFNTDSFENPIIIFSEKEDGTEVSYQLQSIPLIEILN